MKDAILALRSQGQSYRQIQKALGCSKGTIAYHLGQGCREKTHARTRVRRKLTITKLKLKYGGKCIVCGWHRCLRGLAFHHRDPSTKKFGISEAIRRKPDAEIEAEAAKCDLLCCNCHAMVHEGLLSLLPPINR